MGTVRDPLGQPIRGAEVRVTGSELAVFTSDSGHFQLLAPRVLPVAFQIRRPGYRAQFLSADGDWSGSIVMQEGVYELPEINVKGRMAKPVKYAGTYKYDGFFQRQRRGFGEFVSREQIDRRPVQHVAQLFEGRAGIRVDFRQGETASGSPATIVAFARCNEFPPKINVYVDGHKLQPRILWANSPAGDFSEMTEADALRRREVRGMVGEMLERVNPADIEMIEIYRGPGELPGEFSDGNCGAIVIWTREGGR